MKILITGGTSGLGLEIAKLTLEKGSEVFVCAREEKDLPAGIKFVKCDVTSPESVENLSREIGDIDVLINNAGIWLEGSVEKNSFDEISKLIDINLKGYIYTTKIFLPKMLEKKRGMIINISSTSGIEAKPNSSVYVASKFGVTGFTEGLKADLVGSGVKIVGVYPGGMRTELFKSAGSNREVDKFVDPKDIAKVIVNIIDEPDSMVSDHVVIRRTQY